MLDQIANLNLESTESIVNLLLVCQSGDVSLRRIAIEIKDKYINKCNQLKLETIIEEEQYERS